MTRRARLAAIAALVLAAAAVPGALQWPTERPPDPLPARPVTFPAYQIRTLANGLTVLVVPHHEQPAVSFRLLVRAGSVHEPADKPGVARFVASLLNQGTAAKSAGQIADLIDSAGGIVGTGSGNELSFVNGAIVKDRTDLALGLAAEMVQTPAFIPREIDHHRQQMLSALQVSYDDPDFIADLVFDRLVYGFHAYGRPNEGTPESIRRITRDDLVAFHQRWYRPNNAWLAIVGDLSAAEAFAAAERAFGPWVRQELPPVPAAEPPPPTRRVVVVDRPGSAQTEVRVGQLAVAHTHPDYLPFDLGMRVLGGEGANRLFGVLRADRGLTYGASAELRTYRSAGNFIVETDTRSAATAEVLRLTLDEVARLSRERVDFRALRGAKDYLQGSFPLTIETPGAIALQVLNQLFYGRDLKELETFRERVERVSVDEIQRVAREFIKPDLLTIVLVGDASVFANDLPRLGMPEFERIPLAELDLGSPTLRRRAGGGSPEPADGRREF